MRRKPSILAYALLLVALFVCDVSMAAACSIPYNPNPWYLATVHFDTQGLPAGLNLQHRDDKEYGELYIENSSSTPLYLLSPEGSEFKGTHVIPDMPQNLTAVHKFVSDEWYEWSGGRWILLDQKDRPFDIQAHAWYVTNTVLHVETRPFDDIVRPGNAEVPAPRQTALDVIYGDKLLSVPVDITYVLNPDYDPKFVYNLSSGGGCYSNAFQSLCMIVLGFVVVVIGIGLWNSRRLDVPNIRTDL
jgi:hypothetical protein